MNEQHALLLETAERVFADCTGERDADGARIDAAGLPGLLVPESDGGFGGCWQDAGAIARLAGKHALDYPVMDAILSAHLAAQNGADWDAARRFRTHAALLAAQMAGALESALNLSVEHTRQRQQFGKALASFQAIQQQLAVLAEETAAATMAAAAAFVALDCQNSSDGGAFACMAAKLRANRAASIGTGIAHQVHGAMGFTREYALQKFTRRLWAWQSEFGNERYWADAIGKAVAARGPKNFWSDLVEK